MSSDPFSDIVSFTNAESLVTGGFTAGDEWAIRFPVPDKIKFFAIVKGHCWVSIEGEDTWVRFNTGDIGLLTAPRSFILASSPEVTPIDAMSAFAKAPDKMPQLGNGLDFTHIGGHVLLDKTSGRLLLDVLPPWIHVPSGSAQAANFQWLLNLLVEERSSALPGSRIASAQLSQLLFVQILRAHLMNAGDIPKGWLSALNDPAIAPAIQMMHAEPDKSWNLDELAKLCAMSRTVFASHFKKVVGDTPLAYLTKWRMALAEKALRTGSMPISAIAYSSGYSSESAFSNAFKRITGKSPKVYRKAAQTNYDGE